MMFCIAHIPEEEVLFEKYTVTINGERAPLHCARVSKQPYNTAWPGCQRPIDQTEMAAFLQIESDEPLEIEVIYDYLPQEVVVRPLSKEVQVFLDGKKARLRISQAGQYTVEADGFHEALHLFIDVPRNWGISEASENVLYFGAGVHYPGRVLLRSDQTVYVDRDAVVYGSFAAFGCENVHICGYGIIDGSWEKRTTDNNVYMTDENRTLPYLSAEDLLAWHEKQRVLWGAVQFWNCRNVCVEGCILRDTAGFAVIPGGCDEVVVDNVKTIGMWRYNSDGIDVINSRNVRIENCFTRNFDDCIVIKGIMGHDTLNNENITVKNCTVWCDWGRALEIGAETCAPEYRNIVFENCDLIHGADVYMDIQHINHAQIHDVLFDDIRLEYSKYHLSPVYQNDMDVPYLNPVPAKPLVAAGIYIHNLPGLFCSKGYANGSVRNIEFRNIQIFVEKGAIEPVIELRGLDEVHSIENVAFRNVTINDRSIKSFENVNTIMRGTVKKVRIE